MCEKQFDRIAHFMIKAGTDYLERKISKKEFRKSIYDLVIMERNIPYDEEDTKYISGVGYEALKPNVLFSDKKHFNATFNTLLPNRGLMSNMLIKDFIYDLFFKESKLDMKELDKIHVGIIQYIKPTKKGKLPKDADNNDKKGVIDGISEAFLIDDSGDKISYSSDIEPLPEGKKSGYTELIVIPHAELKEIYKKIKDKWKD